eukprot:CFRG8459T1
MLDAAFTVLFAVFLGRILDVFHDKIVHYSNFTAKSSLKSQLHESRELAKAIRSQMKELSIQDDFAQHSKLQRKLNAEEQKISKSEKEYQMEQYAWGLKVYGVKKVFMGLLHMYILYHWRSVPIFQLKPSMVYPFGYILAFPMHETGDVGIVFWFFVCRTLVKII